MSIINSYDESRPLINPENFYKQGKIAGKCIVFFSHRVLEDVLKRYNCKKEATSGTANGKIQIYSLMQDDEKILFYMSPIGSAVAGCVMDEVRYITGAEKFIVFGSCGILDKELTSGKLIVPTDAYRDEGLSYHYAQASDYIEVKNCNMMSDMFDKMKIPYISGKIWTTDAIYRETENNIVKRKEEGCIAVEMECAGLQAVCNYRNIELYDFLFGSDVVEGSVWNNINLGTKEEKRHQIKCFEIALKIAKGI